MSFRFLGALASAAALAAGGANAATFLLSFSTGAGFGDTGGLTIDASPDSGGQYTVTSVVSGNIDGSAASAYAPGDYYGNDELVFFPGTPSVDHGGVAFHTAEGGDYLVSYTPGYGYYVGCEGGSVCGFGTGTGANLSLTQVASAAPEPAAWALMLTGFAGLGAVLRSRRKLAAA